ncbi:MAG: response regulator [Planctomycetes bacterium]|nr:response regulator [Planctomycetota bacterium]
MLTLPSSHVVVDCPICGRPLEISSPLVSQEIACGHCCGEFTVYETAEGSLATSNWEETDPLERAEQLLLDTSRTDLPDSEHCDHQRFPRRSAGDDKTCPKATLSPLPQEAEGEQKPQPTVLLVEYRDEVFTRIATDLTKLGIRVIRAKAAIEAMRLFGKYKPQLVVANTDLPGQSGWLLTAKIRLLKSDASVWLYHGWPRNYGHAITRFLALHGA